MAVVVDKIEGNRPELVTDLVEAEVEEVEVQGRQAFVE
jgi:hypothetical protein